MSNEERRVDSFPSPGDALAPPPVIAVAERPPRPTSVTVATVAVGVLLGLSVLGALGNLAQGAVVPAVFQILIPGLVFAGVVKGHRLAWQWGRIVAMLSAVLTPLASMAFYLGNKSDPHPFMGITLIISTTFCVVLLLAVFFALGRPSAKAFFGLVCPKCGQPTSKAADFFFNKARCRECDYTWR